MSKVIVITSGKGGVGKPLLAQFHHGGNVRGGAGHLPERDGSLCAGPYPVQGTRAAAGRHSERLDVPAGGRAGRHVRADPGRGALQPRQIGRAHV